MIPFKPSKYYVVGQVQPGVSHSEAGLYCSPSLAIEHMGQLPKNLLEISLLVKSFETVHPWSQLGPEWEKENDYRIIGYIFIVDIFMLSELAQETLSEQK